MPVKLQTPRSRGPVALCVIETSTPGPGSRLQMVLGGVVSDEGFGTSYLTGAKHRRDLMIANLPLASSWNV